MAIVGVNKETVTCEGLADATFGTAAFDAVGLALEGWTGEAFCVACEALGVGLVAELALCTDDNGQYVVYVMTSWLIVFVATETITGEETSLQTW